MKALAKLPKTLVIDRARWLRGDGDGKLLDENGKMCCLGFLSRAIGYAPREIRYKLDPTGIVRARPSKRALRFGALLAWPDKDDPGRPSRSVVCDLLVHTNDDAGMSDRAREARIERLFARVGVKVRFVGETVKP